VYVRHVNEVCVVENESLPALSIVVNGRVLGFVDPYDSWETSSPVYQRLIFRVVQELKPAVIFKYQARRGVRYPAGTISAGYPCAMPVPCPEDLLTRARPIDIAARMRVNHDYHWGTDEQWMLERSRIVEQAQLLEREGYNSKWGLIPRDQYVAELWNAQIGFDWRGVGYLTRRVIEFIRAGVVPITRPLGEEWPVREDVVLEDASTAYFARSPANSPERREPCLRTAPRSSASAAICSTCGGKSFARSPRDTGFGGSSRRRWPTGHPLHSRQRLISSLFRNRSDCA
jgi:hypothetical protein